MMNNQSSGKVSISDNSPTAPPAIDLNFLSAQWDVEATIEAVRKTVQFMKNATIPIGELAVGPSSLDDADILVRFSSLH